MSELKNNIETLKKEKNESDLILELFKLELNNSPDYSILMRLAENGDKDELAGCLFMLQNKMLELRSLSKGYFVGKTPKENTTTVIEMLEGVKEKLGEKYKGKSGKEQPRSTYL